MTTQFYEHGIFLEHETPAAHPDHPDRLRALAIALEHPHFSGLDRRKAEAADIEAALLAHGRAHVEAIRRQIPEPGSDRLARIENDTFAGEKSLEAALTAIGSAMAAVDAVMAGAADNAFIACRPAGHHAGTDRSMGFCLFNNAAIAARHAQQAHGVERVAIIDWDVHHGNGTQDIFWNDRSVLFCSSHQMPLYPHSGARDETGAHGNIVNVPLSPGSGSEHFHDAFRSQVLPAVVNFSPDLIVISAGFDAHYRDPFGRINLVGNDFDWATGRLMEIADKFAGNRIVSLLEGGYDLEGLAESAAMHILRLMRG